MNGREYRVIGDLARSDVVMRDTFWIGVYPGLTAAHIDFMLESIRRFVAMQG